MRPAGSPATSAPQWLRRVLAPRAGEQVMNRLRLVRDRRVPLHVLAERFVQPPALLARRGISASSGDSLHSVDQRGMRLLAHDLPSADLGVVRLRNLSTVVEALERMGVEHFLVDNRSPTRTAVAVDETDRRRVLAGLRSQWGSRPIYLSLSRVLVRSFERPALAHRVLGWPGAEAAEVIRIFEVFAAGSLVVGSDFGCDLEFWRTDEQAGLRLAPRENRVAPAVPVGARDLPLSIGGRSFRGLEPFAVTTAIERDFPIDVVYTWVDGADPQWAARRDHHLGVSDRLALNEQAANLSRYLSRDELRYSLRSLYMFAPWVNHIWLVTDDQTPPWLDTSSDRVTVVSHRDIFTDPSVLPAFNSHAIESQLHHIDGLAEHYVYLNDDMLLGRPVPASRFFHDNGIVKMFPSSARIDYGPPSVVDLPVMAAAKNNREILLRDYGRYVTQKQKHAPYPHLRSMMQELEKRYPEEFSRTAASRFRHPADVSIASSLQQNYGFLTGRTVPAGISYSYFDLSEPSTPARLRQLAALHNLDAFCCNDTDAEEGDLEAQLGMVQDFFRSYFPLPAPWERR